jgi:predicted permease
MFKDLKQILRKEQVNLFLIMVFPIFFCLFSHIQYCTYAWPASFGNNELHNFAVNAFFCFDGYMYFCQCFYQKNSIL